MRHIRPHVGYLVQLETFFTGTPSEIASVCAQLYHIVDLVETGSTLRANGLIEIRQLMQSQAVLIVNRAAFRLKADQIRGVIASLRQAIETVDGSS